MKKSISLLLAILMLFVFTACSDTTKDTDASYQTTHKSEELTVQEAKDIVINYLNSSLGTKELSDKLLDKISAKSIKYLEITSIEDNGSNSNTGYFKFTIRGNFFGYDEYGTLVDRYVYANLVTYDTLLENVDIFYGTVYSK